MNYESMTDQQINRDVASWFYCPNWLSRHAEKLGMIPDYCNDPSAAWPVIVDGRVSILITDGRELINEAVIIDRHLGYDDDEVHCEISYSAQNDNPLKAAMICFLKMKDAKQ